jgi:hypothetical protein
MPDPTTVASRKNVPNHSAMSLRIMLCLTINPSNDRDVPFHP